MTRGAPKGLWPAVTTIQQVAFSRLRIYEHYDQDVGLREALTGFHHQWWGELGGSLRRLDDCLPDLDDAERQLTDLMGAELAGNYLEELRALAAAAGLDRIPMVGTPPAVITGYLPSGTAQAHRFLWALDKALLWEAAAGSRIGSMPAVVRPTFVSLASFGAPIPAVDTSIAGLDARWDPRTELLADARRRLRHETDLTSDAIELELARISRDGEYQFPDTSTQRSGIWRLDRDSEWVWWRIRRRWTYEQIAREWERLHPGDFRLQYRLDDDEARRWKVENPHEAGMLMVPAEAVGLVRKAVRTFARRARVDARFGPGRRGNGALSRPKGDQLALDSHRASRRARPPATRSRWEADTLPTELLPLASA
jgi:hypothetical protein